MEQKYTRFFRVTTDNILRGRVRNKWSCKVTQNKMLDVLYTGTRLEMDDSSERGFSNFHKFLTQNYISRIKGRTTT